MAKSKKQTTFAKLARERSVQEKRVLKQERKEERKQAAAAARIAEAEGATAEAAPDADPEPIA